MLPTALKWSVWLLAAAMLQACAGLPKGVEPVQDFDIQRYLGTWYEIARLDHSFERGLEQVTATYSLRDDGGVRVINRGFSVADKAWEQAEGKAYFMGASDVGHLRVSFFGPFYGAYVVFGLDKTGYEYAFVSGPNRSYLWLLARTPTVAPDVIDQFTQRARALGFATDELIFVRQSPRDG